MKRKSGILVLAVVMVFAISYFLFTKHKNIDADIISYQVSPAKQDIKMYWKDDEGRSLKSLGNLQSWLNAKGQQLLFAMNGGMYKADGSPQGLYIQNGIELIPLDTSTASGNFYLKPNGVFYLTRNRQAGISATEQFPGNRDMAFATQSGPMLLLDGKIHPAFTKGSANKNIRNGVGILPGGDVVFAMSKKEINFYDFAIFFKNLGCRNALYLDGLVSRTYLPEKDWVQRDGNFGVIIGISKER